MLVLSAGGGREVRALRQRGLQVYAADCDARYVQRMKELFSGDDGVLRIELVGPNEAPRDLPALDAVLIGWGAYTHIPGRDARVALLRRLEEKLEAGAPLFFSFWAERGGSSSRLERVSRGVERAVHRGLGRRVGGTEAGDRVVPPGFFGYIFNRSEIEAEVEAAGFRLVRYESKPYGCAVVRPSREKGAKPPLGVADPPER